MGASKIRKMCCKECGKDLGYYGVALSGVTSETKWGVIHFCEKCGESDNLNLYAKQRLNELYGKKSILTNK